MPQLPYHLLGALVFRGSRRTRRAVINRAAWHRAGHPTKTLISRVLDSDVGRGNVEGKGANRAEMAKIARHERGKDELLRRGLVHHFRKTLLN